MSKVIFTNYTEVKTGQTIYVQNVSFPSFVQIDWGDGTGIKTYSNSDLIQYTYTTAGKYTISVYDFSSLGDYTIEDILFLADENGNFFLSSVDVLATSDIEYIGTSTTDELIEVGSLAKTYNISDFIGNTLTMRVYDTITPYTNEELTNIYTNIALPYTEIKVSSNQTINYTVLNTLFDRLYDNFTYIGTQTRFIDTFKNNNEFISNLSATIGTSNNSITWDMTYDITLSAGNNLTDLKATENAVYISDSNTLYSFDFKHKTGQKIYLTSGKYNYTFTNLQAFDVKNDNEFYIIDNGLNMYRLRVLNDLDLKLIAYKLFSSNISDIIYNKNDNRVYVVSNDEGKIYKFTENFEMIGELEIGGIPLKIAYDNLNNIFVYDQRGVISVINSDFTTFYEITVGAEFNFKSLLTYIQNAQFSNVKKFIADRYGYYFYICFDGAVIKVGRNGKVVSAVVEGTDLRSVFQDGVGNLFVVSKHRIEKYYSGIELIQLRKDDINILYTKEQFHFNSKETVSSWIYNQKVIRFLNMLERYIVSLKYRLIVSYDNTDISGFSFTDLQFSNLVQVVDYTNLNYLIGSNEIVSSLTINRSLKAVNDILQRLLDALSILRYYDYSTSTFYLPNLTN